MDFTHVGFNKIIMSTYFISRHQGAKDWAQLQNITVDFLQTHLDIADIKSGDVVIGTLPINLVAQLVERGASYYHLTLNLTENLRGKELSASDMQKAGASLERYSAKRIL